MSWRDKLKVAAHNKQRLAPWISGKSIITWERAWEWERNPPHEGWWSFSVDGNIAKHHEHALSHEASYFGINPEPLRELISGYLVGDQMVCEGQWHRVHLIPPNDRVDRFSYATAGRSYPDGPYIYSCSLPMNRAQAAVYDAYLERVDIGHIKDVTPDLRLAFRMECVNREAIERRHREEAERAAREELRRKLLEQLGDGSSRRQMAAVDFNQAVKAALAVGGAELLDVRESDRSIAVVKFRLGGRRFECTCNMKTLGIVDSGICLRDHITGEVGDDRLTLESLPSVIEEAIREHKLHVYRHV